MKKVMKRPTRQILTNYILLIPYNFCVVIGSVLAMPGLCFIWVADIITDIMLDNQVIINKWKHYKKTGEIIR